MHVSYNMHVIYCNMTFTCVTFRIGFTSGGMDLPYFSRAIEVKNEKALIINYHFLCD